MFFKKAEEEQLMMQVAKGDEKAFRRLALMYQKPLCSFCSKFLNGHNAYVDDVVQQVLIAWWQKAPSWKKEKGLLKSWVFTIAANKCRDYLKRPAFKHEELKDENIILQVEIECNIHNSEQNSHLLEAMNQLNEKQKQVLWMVYYEDVKQTDVANNLRLSVKSVENHLLRGKKKLNSLLGELKGDLL